MVIWNRREGFIVKAREIYGKGELDRWNRCEEEMEKMGGRYRTCERGYGTSMGMIWNKCAGESNW